MYQPRLRRWALRGALILAVLASILGLLFNSFFVLVQQSIPTVEPARFWLSLVVTTILVWGIGGAFFGGILGAFASLIWRDD